MLSTLAHILPKRYGAAARQDEEEEEEEHTS
jgi:hypothetical protein